MYRRRYLEEPDEPYVICASCEEALTEAEAAELDGAHYHPDCAGVSRCPECGRWNENDQTCPDCESEGIFSREHSRDAIPVLIGLGLILAFALGLVLGVKVEQADQKLAAKQAAVEVTR